MEVEFCLACSQVVNSRYIFCPQCGAKLRNDSDLPAILDESLSPLDDQEKIRALAHLDNLLGRLTGIEDGLESIPDLSGTPEGEHQSKD